MIEPPTLHEEQWAPGIDGMQSRSHFEPPEPSLGDLFAALRRHTLLIAGCVVTTVALAAAYTLYAKPVFESSALVRFEAERVDLPQLVQLPWTDNLITTELEVLKRRGIAVPVIDSLGLRAQLQSPRRGQISRLFATLRVTPAADSQTILFTAVGNGVFNISRADSSASLGTAQVGDTSRIAGVLLGLGEEARALPEIKLHISTLNSAADNFESALKLSRPARDADLIAISFRDNDPVRAAGVANLMAHNLIADRQMAHRGRTGAAAVFLAQQAESLGVQLRSAEESLRAYQQREHVIDVPQQASAEVTRLAKLQADLAGVRSERDAFAALVNDLREENSGAAVHGQSTSRRLMAFPSLLSNQSAAVLLGALAQVETERSQLLIRRTPADSDVVMLTARIHDMEVQLQGIAESYLQGLTNQVASLEREGQRFGTQLDALPEKELQSARRERDTKVLNDLYVLVQTRLKEAEITGAAGDPTVRIADAAVPAVKPVRPKPMINLALSLVLGGLVGATATLLREHSDRSVRSRDDARLASGLPVLGAFPRLQLDRRARAALRSGVEEARKRSHWSETPRDGVSTSILSKLLPQPWASPAYVESFNQLFTNLELRHREKPLKVVVFTSPLPGEGKTLSAINFSLVGAARGLKMLLIDADLRCGQIAEVLGCNQAPGLSEVLAGSAAPMSAVRHVSVGQHGTIAVMSSGARPKVPGGLLTLERMRTMLSMMTPQFDFVIIDSPPVNLLADASLLGSAADAVLLVIRAGHTEADDLRFAINQLGTTGAPVLGTLLNDIDLRRDAGYDSTYRYVAAAGRDDDRNG